MGNIFTPPPDAIREIRGRNYKLCERPRQAQDPQGHRRYQLQSSLQPVHVPSSVRAWHRGDPMTWDDPDTNLVRESDHWRVGNAYYRIRMDDGAIGFEYSSRTEGSAFVSVLLTHLDGVPLGSVPAPTQEGNVLRWEGVAPGLDLFIRLGVWRIDLRKRILNASAPRSFRWHVRQTDPLPLPFNTVTIGQDNFDRAEPARVGLGPGAIRREVEMTHTPSGADRSVSGELAYTLEETWTGRTLARNPRTRAKEPSTEVVYPVEIDVLVEEEIAADADDGNENSEAWSNSYSASDNSLIWDDTGSEWVVGFRFTTVAIPQGATISDATFAVERAGTSGSLTADLVASDEDDAGAWTDSTQVPTVMTGTTAATNVTWTGTSGTDVSADVASQIQEVVDRGGWATGNAIALFADVTTFDGGWTGHAYLEDEADADAGAARLDVNYTVGGGGGEFVKAAGSPGRIAGGGGGLAGR